MKLLIIILFLSSCTVAKIGGRGAVPIMLNQPSEQMNLSEHIVVKKNSTFDYTKSYDASEILSDVIAEKKPDAVINTTVKIKIGIDNFLFNLFTLGIANSRKIVIECDLMKKI